MTKTLTHLQTPGNTEGGHTADVRAAELGEVLEKNTPAEKSHERRPEPIGGFFLTM